MTHADLLSKLGGGTAVARALAADGHKVDREAVYKWANNGIPLKWRFQVAKIARQHHAKLPKGFLPEMAQ